MNVLILGKGGREHALAKAVASSPTVKQVFVLPGREGFVLNKVHLSPTPLEKDKLKEQIQKQNIKLVVIGPEKELHEGWSDFFRSEGVAVFGPSQSATRLESSKLFAKQFMLSARVPTPDFKKISSVKEALQNAEKWPVVLKADGLAAGKGVFICHNEKELKKCAELLFEKKIFGKAGEHALLEKFKKGEELSAFVLTNGKDYTLLPFAKDYKKLKDHNQGPNTGGMGAFAPYVIPAELKQKIEEQVVQPSVQEIKKQNLFYRGVLYIGLMIVEGEPFVLEYNVRFGDPEAQVLLPLLKGDWAKVFLSIAEGNLPALNWKKDFFSACVVLAGGEYPARSSSGVVIEGNINKQSEWAYFLHAGTKKTKQNWVTDGGRILNALGIGNTKEKALEQAYKQASYVHWPGKHQRSDITFD